MPGGRVLMIAHHFPPAGGSGSNRALAFARYLPRFGWQPVVLTPGAAWAMNRDDRLLGELPADVQVIRTRSWEPRPGPRPPLPLGVDSTARSAGEGAVSSGDVRALDAPSPLDKASPTGRGSRLSPGGRGRLRAHIGHLKRFPDAHLGWLPFALAATTRVSFDVAYSSSGPFTSHLVGLALKRLTGRAWVAELRDGWYRWNRAIFPDYPAWRDRLERRLEAIALRSADRVVLVTDRMADTFRCQYADLPPEHFAVVANGFDPAQFPTAAEPTAEPSEPIAERRGWNPALEGGSWNPVAERRDWNVVHAGALYYGRSLAAFFEAVARVAAADASFAHQFRLTLVGTLDTTARAELSRGAIATRVQARGQLDHAPTIEAMRAADALLLIANTTPGAEATVPGKLFEYLAVGRPVLAIAPTDSSTADVLQRTGGGWLARAGDPEAIASILCRAFHERSCRADPDQVARFDRRVLAGDLARIFDQAVASAARRA